ncbi:KH domain family protein [Clavispora lusitaniae]|uniref:K Homology domain-containing protein n=1 Tax=Clavispora lusitaniae (strain ATCC 42720) TaxID=306902 RepID=C4YA09_CLAL4|nr:uncharacterized protein CLUG_04947 [Clavispora lusitaniae ATCC 42720]EEQ40819.1 hypothetical protein CLUG_04947 [Clavispora lusitaniae ATCC 42720]KAF5209301.1 RNA binding protein, heterogenous nuclear RNP-K like protein [Clavispora lusitaniae]KAF7580962.1 KH domain family protein [Clavispora lusitaniae]
MSEDDILPSLETQPGLINFRVLVSAKEAGCLIGQNGAVIDSIRDETATRAGISQLRPGTHERILTVSGLVDSAAKALSYFAQALVNASSETPFSYSYFPLKQMSRIANVEGQTTVLRMMVPNSQIGTLIGARGLRIQQIQRQCNVSMIVSKSFLAGSSERLVELQGTVDNLYDAVRIVGRCLLSGASSSEETVLYVPRPSSKAAEVPKPATTQETVSFRDDIVGALIGKHGSRIQGVRKVSGATIAISEEDGTGERSFTISGSPSAVGKAKRLLAFNLEREEQRRADHETHASNSFHSDEKGREDENEKGREDENEEGREHENNLAESRDGDPSRKDIADGDDGPGESEPADGTSRGEDDDQAESVSTAA